MKLVSVSVGRPREAEWDGENVLTSIFKAPVAGRVRVGRLNIEGDEQSDLEVHGGEDKAVYAYPGEHYAYWREQLPGVPLPWGVFGENLTMDGLLEGGVHIGDRLRMGSAEFVVTEPRMPCYKLALRFGRPDMVKRFLKSGRTGFYLAVMKEGEIGAGDTIELVPRDAPRMSVAAVVAAKSRSRLADR
jgi:MOSC domain-containing protein YiiM